MSWVANMVLSIHSHDQERLPALNEWLHTKCPWNGPSVPPDATGVGYLENISGRNSGWGGWKSPECEIWVGALNHADLDAVRTEVARFPWEHPGCVQLLLMDQEESHFRLWMIRDRELRQYAPPPDPSDGMSM